MSSKPQPAYPTLPHSTIMVLPHSGIEKEIEIQPGFEPGLSECHSDASTNWATGALALEHKIDPQTQFNFQAESSLLWLGYTWLAWWVHCSTNCMKYILKYLHYSTSGLGIISHFACAVTSYLLTTSFYWLYLTLQQLYHILLNSTRLYSYTWLRLILLDSTWLYYM